MESKLDRMDEGRRVALLNAALSEFAARGYEDASTNVIARSAGISKALMFHYVESKQQLFLLTVSFFTELLDRSYFRRIDIADRDLLSRLRRSYELQIRLMRRYPSIFEFSRLLAPTGSHELDARLRSIAAAVPGDCAERLLEDVDDALFRPGLDPARCKQFIAWVSIGFTDEILRQIRSRGSSRPTCDEIMVMIDGHLEELRHVFYA